MQRLHISGLGVEPERPATDQKVLEFIKGHGFDPADFTIRSDGVCRLHPEMASHIVRPASPDLTTSIAVVGPML
jgi:hypothetical protein